MWRWWDDIWFQPVHWSRIRLLAISFFCLLVVDCADSMLPRAAVYGAAGFNVSHFPLLDGILPLPSPGSYVAAVFLVAVGAALLAALWIPPSMVYRTGWRGCCAVLTGLAFVLYTACWAWSLLDGFQHHYLLSWMLLMLCFFAQPSLENTASRLRVAWAFQLLGAILAIVYVYTAIAKIDSGWLSGHTLSQWSRSTPFADHILGEDILRWRLLALAVIACEFTIAVGYASVVVRGERLPNWLRYPLLTSALGLHVAIELADLEIGWFSYYMMFTAVAYFLPASIFDRFSQPLPEPPVSTAASSGTIVGGKVIILGVLCLVCGFLVSHWYNHWLPGLFGTYLACSTAGLGLTALSWFSKSQTHWLGVRLVFAANGVLLLFCLSPGHLGFHLTMAKDLRARGQLANASSALERAAAHVGSRRTADRVALFHELALVHDAQGNYDQALEMFRKSLQLKSTQPRVHYHLGNTLQKLAKYKQARAAYQQALALQNRFVAAQHNVGVTYAKQGKYKSAITAYRRALKLDDHFFESRLQLGSILIVVPKRPREALTVLEGLDKLRPRHFEVRRVLGLAYHMTKKYLQARDQYEVALQLKPNRSDVLINLGTVCRKVGDRKAAQQYLRKVLNVDPGGPHAEPASDMLREMEGE